MKAASITQMFVRIIGLIQLTLGVIFWTGNAVFLVPAHILLGAILVFSLWMLSYLAARSGVPIGLVILTAVWGFVLPVWGMAQAQILPGASHWITQVLHLFFGVGAIGLAEMLATRMHPTSTSSAHA